MSHAEGKYLGISPPAFLSQGLSAVGISRHFQPIQHVGGVGEEKQMVAVGSLLVA